MHPNSGVSNCLFRRLFQEVYPLKPPAIVRNFVGQQLPTLLDVTCCVRLRTLLHVVRVVAQSLKPVKRSTTRKRTQQVRTLSGQQCWDLLRPFLRVA